MAWTFQKVSSTRSLRQRESFTNWLQTDSLQTDSVHSFGQMMRLNWTSHSLQKGWNEGSKYMLCSSVFLYFSRRERQSRHIRLPVKTLVNVASQMHGSSHSSRLNRIVISWLLFLCRLYHLAWEMTWETESKERNALCMWSHTPAGCRGSCLTITITDFIWKAIENRLRRTLYCVCVESRVLVRAFSQRGLTSQTLVHAVLCLFAICLVFIKDSQPLHFWSIV